MIKATIFDMDGLMFDTESAYSIVQSSMSKKRGKVFTNEIKKTLMGIKAAIAAGCNTCAVLSEYTKDVDFSYATLVCNSLRDQAKRMTLFSLLPVSIYLWIQYIQ